MSRGILVDLTILLKSLSPLSVATLMDICHLTTVESEPKNKSTEVCLCSEVTLRRTIQARTPFSQGKVRLRHK